MPGTHTSNPRANIMVAFDAMGLIACVVAIVVLAMNAKLDAVTATVLTTAMSYFGLSLRDAHSFEFGSSRGSRDKDVALAAATVKQAEVATNVAEKLAETSKAKDETISELSKP